MVTQKCNEQVKPNMWYNHAKFDIYYIYDVGENPKVKDFKKTRHLTTKNMKNFSLECTLESYNSHCAQSSCM